MPKVTVGSATRTGVTELPIINASGETVATATLADEHKLQSKPATLKNTAQTITPDSGYDGLSSVTIPAITGTKDYGTVSSNGTLTIDVTGYQYVTLDVEVSGGTTRTLSSIAATYTGGNVDAGTTLADLTGLTVTATYSVSDGTTATAEVTGYTLSGSIVADMDNTISVSYTESGVTAEATFIVHGNSGPVTTSKNLLNPELAVTGYVKRNASFELVEASTYVTAVIPVTYGHKYKGVYRTGTGNDVKSSGDYGWQVTANDSALAIPGSFNYLSENPHPTISNAYIFSSSADRYVEITNERATYMILGFIVGTTGYSASDLMIYDYTENGLLTTFEEYA